MECCALPAGFLQVRFLLRRDCSLRVPLIQEWIILLEMKLNPAFPEPARLLPVKINSRLPFWSLQTCIAGFSSARQALELKAAPLILRVIPTNQEQPGPG